MDKVTYSSDTTAAVPGANLSSARYYVSATGNSTDGYFGGGSSPSVIVATMDKITYSTDTTAAVPGANLIDARYGAGAASNPTHGYFGGGGPGYRSTMDKVTYSTDTTATVPSANLVVPRNLLSATGSPSHGYFGGGLPGPLATMEKTTYASDTTAVLPSGANLSAPRSRQAASSSIENGLPFGEPPTETPSSQTFPLVTSTPNTGYFGGGDIGPLATMEKTTFTSDTTATVPSSANLSTGRRSLAATGNLTHGYFGGGRDSGPSITTTMDKVTYASDTTAAAPGANFNLYARVDHAATGNSTHGYFAGGPSQDNRRIHKVFYSVDITSLLPSTVELDQAVYGLAATGNSTHGYFGGGRYGSNSVSRMEKITYSSDTLLVIPGANLSQRRDLLGATGNSTHGYFGGGQTGPYPTTRVSTMQKITYATDTRTALPSSALSDERWGVSATGNSTDGYFGGGSSTSGAVATMDKITYSSDTTAAVPGANLITARYRHAASSARANGLPTSLTTLFPVIV